MRLDLLRDLTLQDDELVLTFRVIPHGGAAGGAMVSLTVYNAGEEVGIEVGPWQTVEAALSLLSPRGMDRLLSMLPEDRQERLFPLG